MLQEIEKLTMMEPAGLDAALGELGREGEWMWRPRHYCAPL